MCPEHELDSPVRDELMVYPQPVTGQGNALTFPASTEILSPQYCVDPKATAKRIFSVTRVTSPVQYPTTNDPFSFPSLAAANRVVNSPTAVHPPYANGEPMNAISIPQLCMPLPTVDIKSLDQPIPLTVDINTNASPNTIQKGMADQTLENYIQHIVSENTAESTDKDPVKEASNSENVDKVPIKLEAGTVSVVSAVSANESVNVKSGPEEKDGGNFDSSSVKDQQENGSNCDMEDTTKCSPNEHCPQESEKVVSSAVNVVNTGTDDHTVNQVQNVKDEKNREDCVSRKESNNDIGNENDTPGAMHLDSDLQSSDDKKNDSGHSNLRAETNVNDKKNAFEYSENEQCSLEPVVETSPSEKVSKEVCDSEISTGDTNTQSVKITNENNDSEEKNNPESVDPDEEFVQCEKSLEPENVVDSQVGDNNESSELSKSPVDSEPWNPVNIDPTESPLESVKPDFHTNLSINGLKQELASLIDEETPMTNGAVPHNKVCHVQDTGMYKGTELVNIKTVT